MAESAFVQVAVTLVLGLLGYAVLWGRIQERLKTVNTTLDNFRSNHTTHFTSASAIDSRMSSQEASQRGHEELDNERFMQLDKKLDAMRDDIREVLAAVRKK